MNAIFKHPTLRLTALVVFSTAGLVGWKLAEPARESAESGSGKKETAGKRDVRPTRNARSAAADQAGKRMASIRMAGSPDARMRATVDLALSLSPAEIAAWMEGGWFTLRGPELTLFTKIVMERWKLEDEFGLLAWTMKGGNAGSGALGDLAKKHPERVLEFFRENPSGSREMMILWEMGKDHPDLALTRFQEIVASGRWRDVQGYAGELMQTLAQKDPSALAAAMKDFPAAVRLQAEAALSRERMKESFTEELHALWERPDGWRIFEGYIHSMDDVGDKLLSELGNLPPAWRTELASNPYYVVKKENAEQWWSADLAAVGFSPSDIGRLRVQALSVIGEKDPEEALRRMGDLEMERLQKTNFINNLLSSTGDQEKARKLVSYLTTEEDRKNANDMLDQRFASTSPATRPENPVDWLARAAESDPEQGGTSYALYSVLDDWDEGKKEALAAGFRALEADKKAVVAESITNSIGNFGRMPDQLAGEALRYMIGNPRPEKENANRYGAGLVAKAGAYAVQLSTRDPAAASQWVASLPAGETKAWTQRNLLNNWKQYDPKAAAAWENSLPAAERAALEEISRAKVR